MKLVLIVLCLLCFMSSCYATCNVSDQISPIDSVVYAFDGNPLFINFTVKNLDRCGAKEYIISIYYHNISKFLLPTQYPDPHNDTGVCNVMLVQYNITREFDMGLLQILIHDNPVICSNLFTLRVQGILDPVNITAIVVNCSTIYITWSPPYTLPNVPISYYNIGIPEHNFYNTTTDTYYILTNDIPANKEYTVSVSAINGAGTSNDSIITFNNSIAPMVRLMEYDIQIDKNESIFNFTAYVTDVNCRVSYPTLLIVNVSCEMGYSSNRTFNLNIPINGFINGQLTCPLDLYNCNALFIWSNLNSTVTNNYIESFNTSQIININVINTSCLDIYIQCCYRTPSILWECGIKVNNSNDLTIYNLMVSSNTTINVSHIGNYSIYVYNCYNMTCNYDHVIHHMTANVTDNCIATSTDISPSVTPSNKTPMDIRGIIGGVTGGVVLSTVLILVVLFIIIFCCIRKKKQNNSCTNINYIESNCSLIRSSNESDHSDIWMNPMFELQNLPDDNQTNSNQTEADGNQANSNQTEADDNQANSNQTEDDNTNDNTNGNQTEDNNTDGNQTEDNNTDDNQTEDVNTNDNTNGNQTEDNNTNGNQTEDDNTDGNQTEDNNTDGNQTEDNNTNGNQTEDDNTDGNQTEDDNTDGNQTEDNNTDGYQTEDVNTNDNTNGNQTEDDGR